MRDEISGNDLGSGKDGGIHFPDWKETFSCCWRLWKNGIHPSLSGILLQDTECPQSPKILDFLPPKLLPKQSSSMGKQGILGVCRSPGLFLTIPTFLSWTVLVPVLHRIFMFPGFQRMRKGLRGLGAAQGSPVGLGVGVEDTSGNSASSTAHSRGFSQALFTCSTSESDSHCSLNIPQKKKKKNPHFILKEHIL